MRSEALTSVNWIGAVTIGEKSLTLPKYGERVELAIRNPHRGNQRAVVIGKRTHTDKLGEHYHIEGDESDHHVVAIEVYAWKALPETP